MRLHGHSRGASVNVYPTGRQGAGVRDGDGRSGGSQWNQIEGLVHRSLAAKGRCLGKFGTGRRAHVGRTANMLLIPRMPRRMQPDSVCDVGDRHAEKQSRGDQDTGKQRRALGEACWAACECLRRTATGDGLRQDGGGGAGGAGGVAPARAPSCTQKFVCRKDSGEAVGGMTFVVGHAPAPAPATRPNAGGTSLPLQLCDFDLAGRRQPPSSCSLSLSLSPSLPHPSSPTARLSSWPISFSPLTAPSVRPIAAAIVTSSAYPPSDARVIHSAWLFAAGQRSSMRPASTSSHPSGCQVG